MDHVIKMVLTYFQTQHFVLVTIKCNKSKIMKIKVVLDFNAFAYFIDKDLV
jgi:hypothetical protein